MSSLGSAVSVTLVNSVNDDSVAVDNQLVMLMLKNIDVQPSAMDNFMTKLAQTSVDLRSILGTFENRAP